MTRLTLVPRLIAACALAAAAAVASAPVRADTMVQHKIADNVYTMVNDRGSSNATFFITPDGVLVFDADLKTGDQVLAAIRKLTDKKVKYLVTSHSAGDHATGAWHYREDKPLYISSRRQMHDFYMQEAAEFAEKLKAQDMDLIFLLAPTSTEQRIKQVAQISSGFSYYVSLRGVTEIGRAHVLTPVTATSRMPSSA